MALVVQTKLAAHGMSPTTKDASEAAYGTTNDDGDAARTRSEKGEINGFRVDSLDSAADVGPFAAASAGLLGSATATSPAAREQASKGGHTHTATGAPFAETAVVRTGQRLRVPRSEKGDINKSRKMEK